MRVSFWHIAEAPTVCGDGGGDKAQAVNETAFLDLFLLYTCSSSLKTNFMCLEEKEEVCETPWG